MGRGVRAWAVLTLGPRKAAARDPDLAVPVKLMPLQDPVDFSLTQHSEAQQRSVCLEALQISAFIDVEKISPPKT